MKVARKILAVALAATLALSAIIVTASAYTPEDGSLLTYWSLTSKVADSTTAGTSAAVQEVHAGDTITVTIHLKTSENYYPCSAQVQLYYSKDIFSRDPAMTAAAQAKSQYAFNASSSIVAHSLSTGGSISDFATTSFKNKSYWSAYGITESTYGWYLMTFANSSSAGTVEATADEDLVTVKVKVNDDATAGSTGVIRMWPYEFTNPSNTASLSYVQSYANGDGDPASAGAGYHPRTSTVFGTPDISGTILNFKVVSDAAVVDKTALAATIASTTDLVESEYTKASWSAMQTALTAANTVNANADATQDDVDKANAALTTAISNLAKTTGADYTALDAAISQAEALTSTAYTTTTWSALSTALTAAKGVVRTLTSEDQATITTATTNLTTAISGLKARADVSALKAALDAAAALSSSSYTADSWQTLDDAVTVGQAYYDGAADLSADDQSDVTAATTAINDAIEGLKAAGADYSAVTAALATVPADLSIYTDATAQAVTTAVNAVVYGLGVDQQATVTGYATAINDAVGKLVEKDADYTAVDAAIAAVPADLTIYTDATVDAVNSAVNAVVRGKKVSEQATVTAYATAINDAVAKLAEKDADYTAVNAAIASANALVSSNYTTQTWSALQDAINAVVTGKKISEQTTVTGYATAINEAIQNLAYAGADYSAVTAALAAVPADLSIYTDATAQAVTTAVNAVVYGLGVDQQATVTAYATAINDAVAKLALKDADYTAVTAAQSSAAEKIQSNYTTDSWTALQTALDAVVTGKKADEQAAVDKMAADINEAITNLQYADADYQIYNYYKGKADALTSTDYTKTTWDALQTAISAVVTGLKKDQQTTVDNYGYAVRDAYNALAKAGAADYTAVNAAIASADALTQSNYTTASWATLQAAINAVDTSLNENFQTTVDGYATAINSAIDNLQYADADYTDVDSAIAEAAALKESDYTTETWANLQTAINAVVRGKTVIDQSVVTGYATAIRSAVSALAYKDADYTAVDAAIAAVPADLTGYTDESVAAVNAAVNAVVRGKNITEQTTVDGYAKAINDAVEALETKPAPATGAVEKVEYTKSASLLNKYSVKIAGRAEKAQFIDADGYTWTYTRYSDAVSTKSYTADGKECSDLSIDLAYEVWTVASKLHEGSYKVIGKFTETGWESLDKANSFSVAFSASDIDVSSASFASSSVAVNESTQATIVTGMDVIKVQLVDAKSGATTTLDSATYATAKDGKLVYAAPAKAFAKAGTYTYNVKIKTVKGWQDTETTMTVTVA